MVNMKLTLLSTLIAITSQQGGLPSFDFSQLNNLPNRTTCGSTNPQEGKECFDDSNQFSYCCYLTKGDTKKCEVVSPPRYRTSMTTWTVNGTDYNIDCNVTAGTPGTPCGVVDPATYSNCTSYSTQTNSCCRYYNGNLTNANICVWLGIRLDISPFPGLTCNPPPSSSDSSSSINMVTYLILLVGFILWVN